MAGSPKFKIYRDGKYIGCTKHAEDAAALVAVSNSGTIKYDHAMILWQEGKEEIEAGESYDRAAEIMHRRLRRFQERRFNTAYGIATQS